MSTLDIKTPYRKWAIALIIVNLLRLSTSFIIYFQTEYQLVSPLIPKTIILDILKPYMTIGLVSVILILIAFIFFVYSKFTFAIIASVMNLLFFQIYLLYFPG
jgi:hypothetical protein